MALICCNLYLVILYLKPIYCPAHKTSHGYVSNMNYLLQVSTSHQFSEESKLRFVGKMYSLLGDLPCDTFFFLTGALVAHSFYKSMHKPLINPLLIIFNRFIRYPILFSNLIVAFINNLVSYHILIFYLHFQMKGRYFKQFNLVSKLTLRFGFRLVPSYYLVVWMQMTAFNRIVNGPAWNLFYGFESKLCWDNWWTNFLLINNYYKQKEIVSTYLLTYLKSKSYVFWCT